MVRGPLLGGVGMFGGNATLWSGMDVPVNNRAPPGSALNAGRLWGWTGGGPGGARASSVAGGVGPRFGPFYAFSMYSPLCMPSVAVSFGRWGVL